MVDSFKVEGDIGEMFVHAYSYSGPKANILEGNPMSIPFMRVNIITLFWRTILFKFLQDGIFVPNLKKLGNNADCISANSLNI